MKTYRSNGKLLITGEYVVLDGAKALAIPTKYGQSLTIDENDSNVIIWRSYDEKGRIWFEDNFVIDNDKILKPIQNDNTISNRLIQILRAAQDLSPSFLSSNQGFNITTNQDFNRKWGLGTSSTLINNISTWTNIDAYKLLEKTFGGSGYDIACAQNSTPITYQINNKENPSVEPVAFNPSFKNNLYFVYLNQKQNSRDGIKAYKSLNKIDDSVIKTINKLTESIIHCQSLSEFENYINEHEVIISNLIQKETIQSKWFSDFKGCVKSLGAWGGDFVLVTSEIDPSEYFKHKGFETIIKYENMILN